MCMSCQNFNHGYPTEIRMEFSDLKITNQDIQKVMGYFNNSAPVPFPDLIDSGMEKACDLCDIRLGYVEVKLEDINVENKLLMVKNAVNESFQFKVGKIIFNQLKKAEKIVVFVATAGAGVGDWSRELMDEGNHIEGYIVDCIGTAIVEQAMDQIQEELGSGYSKRGIKTTNRYSPGYCHWHVSEQQKLFQLIPAKFCGIELSPSSLMNPIKSISGFIGIGKNVRQVGYGCKICELDNCLYRNLKAN